MYTYYISVGSNMGNRRQYIEDAFKTLVGQDGIDSLVSSTIIETEPWGYEDQDSFMNALWMATSSLEPLSLLDTLQMLEQRAERKRIIRWGPRTLDLDIIYMVDETGQPISVSDDRLTVPHPHFWDRLFVLEPLRELKSDFIFQGETIDDRIASLK